MGEMHFCVVEAGSGAEMVLRAPSGTNPYSAISAGISALWGPAHGGANEAVMNSLEAIDDRSRIREYVDRANDSNDPFRLMGFGHRVYKNYGPRATIIRRMCHRLLEQLGASRDGPLFELAPELEQIALSDEHLIEKNLYPNVDFYSGIIYRALGIPKSMFTVMFAIARTVGWGAHWRKGVRSGVVVRPASAALYRAGPTPIRSMRAVDPARVAV